MRCALVYLVLTPVIVALLAAGCGKDAAPPQNLANVPANAPDRESWNTTILLSDSIRTTARVQVGHARQYLGNMETLLDSGVYVEFLDENGEPNATLVADSARIDDRTRDMAAFGRVHVQSERTKTTVDTDRLYYEKSRPLPLHSDARVKIVDRVEGRILEGVGFESNESLTDYKIFNASGRTINE